MPNDQLLIILLFAYAAQMGLRSDTGIEKTGYLTFKY
jgi:hypothetical protein